MGERSHYDESVIKNSSIEKLLLIKELLVYPSATEEEKPPADPVTCGFQACAFAKKHRNAVISVPGTTVMMGRDEAARSSSLHF